MIRIATNQEKKYIIKSHPHTKPYLKRKGKLYIEIEKENDIRAFAFIQCRKIFNESHLKECLILVIEVFDPNNRSLGIASNLIEAIKKDSKNDGYYQIIAYYDKHNISSHKLWIKNNFAVAPIKFKQEFTTCQALFKL